jgi:type I restriction enzyme R subunit
VTTPNEYTLVEKPLLDALTGRYGYRAIPPETHPTLRAMENEVLFRPLLVDALVRINGISVADAEAAFHELAGLADNQRWLEVLRGHYSRKLPGEATHRTLRVIDSASPTSWCTSTASRSW